MRMQREFYTRSTLEVAQDLLGKYLIFHSPDGVIEGEINEVEAYLGTDDPASHAYRGKTLRTEVMFGEGGYSYVYFIYGMHNCMNVVTETYGRAGAVLLRSVIPRKGVEIMAKNVKKLSLFSSSSANTVKMLSNGPGKLCKAYGITREHNGIDCTTSKELYLENRGVRVPEVFSTPRIGITKAKEKLWRFYYT